MMKIDHAKLMAGRVAVVSCGDNEVGAAVVRRLAEHGARVFVAVADEATADKYNKEFAETSPSSMAIIMDQRSLDSINDFVLAVKEQEAKVHLFVTTPDVDVKKPLHETTLDDEAFGEDINQKSIVRMMRAIAQMIATYEGGSIVNVTSVREYAILPGNPLYSMEKGGITAFSRVMACEFGACNVRVNNVLSGIATKQNFDEETIAGDVSGLFPLKCAAETYADPYNIADAVLFLGSRMASYINGINLIVDGGVSRELYVQGV